MPFCTSCGANVTGAFCTTCGTPLPASGGQSAAPPPPPPPPQQQYAPPPPPQPPYAQPQYAQPQYQQMPAAQPPRKGMSPILIVLMVLAGLFVLVVVGVIGAGLFVAHKVKQMGNNPALAITKMIVEANPDAEVVSSDDAAGTITVKDRKTGKVVTMNFNDIKNKGNFSFSADDDNGGKATMQFGGDAKPQLPSWLPNYPGSDPKATFSVTGSSADGNGGNYTFTTSDGASKVTEFYTDKIKGSGLTVKSTTTTPGGSTMTASDDGEKRTLVLVISETGGSTTVNVTYAEKK